MSKFIDLTGQKFGRLTVIKFYEKRRRESYYLCKCDCGNPEEKIIRGSSLTSGNTQSCGCLQKEKVKELFKKYNTYDLTGKYGIGYTNKDEIFYFDIENYNLIKDYCWYTDKDGYLITKDSDGYLIRMHRLVMNCPDDMEVDHIYHNLYDNRKEFLRIVNRPQNSMNKDKPSNNTSGIKGVWWDKRRNKWTAEIKIYKKKKYLGAFNNINDAINAREKAEIQYQKEYKYKEEINN